MDDTTHGANLLPAILLGGPPHSGKSVLAGLLDVALKKADIEHILLQTAPDGEGAWFLDSSQAVRAALRHKGQFTPDYVTSMIRAVRRRALPMLVDVGGRPQGRQFELLDACTHSIVLAAQQEELAKWQAWAEARGLISIAALRSTLDEPERLEPGDGPLRGVIAGLDRDQPRRGEVFARLLERVEGICRYDAHTLQQSALRHAPAGLPLVMEHELAQQVGVMLDGQRPRWREQDLAGLDEALPARQPLALFGDGPVFLTAAVAARNVPHAVWTFGARHYGWVQPPTVHIGAAESNQELALRVEAKDGVWHLQCDLLSDRHVLTPQPIIVPPLDPTLGVRMSGKMPKWWWSAVAGHLAGQHPWLAAYYPYEHRFLPIWQRA